jgi:hypothetical protein
MEWKGRICGYQLASTRYQVIDIHIAQNLFRLVVRASEDIYLVRRRGRRRIMLHDSAELGPGRDCPGSRLVIPSILRHIIHKHVFPRVLRLNLASGPTNQLITYRSHSSIYPVRNRRRLPAHIHQHPLPNGNIHQRPILHRRKRCRYLPKLPSACIKCNHPIRIYPSLIRDRRRGIPILITPSPERTLQMGDIARS